jgi:glycosyltransferase involved in cell wall biosynthesis
VGPDRTDPPAEVAAGGAGHDPAAPAHRGVGRNVARNTVLNIAGSGVPLLLALATLPAVIARRGRSVGCGVVVPAGDAEGAVRALIAPAADRAKARGMGEAGRAYAAAEFGREAVVDRLAA